MKNNRGFTLIELMIVAGTSAFAVLVLASLADSVFNASKKLGALAELNRDQMIENRSFSKIFSEIQPSFGNMIGQNDDHGFEFFELYDDYPAEKLAIANAKSRTMTLNKNSKHKEISFLVRDLRRTELEFYNPIDAFKKMSAGDHGTSATLTYVGINQESVVSQHDSAAGKLWSEGELVLMRTPLLVRPVDTDGVVDVLTPAREYVFLGRVKDNDLVFEDLTVDGLGSRFRNIHPATGLKISTAEQYLRQAVSVGGGQPVIVLEAVKAVTLKLENEVNGVYDLNAYYYKGGSTPIAPQLISHNVQEIKFSRSSVTRPLIDISITTKDPQSVSVVSTVVSVQPTAMRKSLNSYAIQSRARVARTDTTRFRVHLACNGNNLRGISNAAATGDMVTGQFKFSDSSNNESELDIEFPAWHALHRECQEDPNLSGCSHDGNQIDMFTLGTLDKRMNELVKVVGAPPIVSGTIAAYKKMFEIDLKKLRPVITTQTAREENADLNAKNHLLRSVTFTKNSKNAAGIVNVAGLNTSVPGQLNTRTEWFTSLDGSEIELHVSIPFAVSPDRTATQLHHETHTDSCEEHYSPLMLFFNDERPRFDNHSVFPITNIPSRIYWPEAEAEAYFLVLDKNENGSVDDGTELFGDQQGSDNGFIELAKYDRDEKGMADGKINKSDLIYKKLKLWRDLNGDGVSQPNELKSLSEMGIEEIDLKYQLETGMFSHRAEYKQRSIFVFKDKKGKKKIGTVLDVWFNSAD